MKSTAQLLEETQVQLGKTTAALVKSEEENTDYKAKLETLESTVSAIRTELDEAKSNIAAIQKAMEPEEEPEAKGEEGEEEKPEDKPEDKPADEETKSLLKSTVGLIASMKSALDAKDENAKAKASAELVTLCASLGIAPPLKTGTPAPNAAAVTDPNKPQLTGIAKTIAALTSKSTK